MSETAFFSIIDTKLKGLTYLDENNAVMTSKPLVLKVLLGVEASPNFQLKTTELSNGESTFNNLLRKDDSFKIKVIINEKDEWNSNVVSKGNITQGKVIEVLDYWMRHTIPVYVVTEAIDIPDGEYLIKGNPSRKQEYRKYTVWDLEFIRYYGNNKINWNFQNKISNKAITDYKKAKQKQAKQMAVYTAKLKKCKRATLKYYKTKKVVTCVKYLQWILKKKGFYSSTIDGWYGPTTLEAVKKYQKK